MPVTIGMNGDSYRLRHSRENPASQISDEPDDSWTGDPFSWPNPARLPIWFLLIMPVEHSYSAAAVHLLAALDIAVGGGPLAREVVADEAASSAEVIDHAANG